MKLRHPALIRIASTLSAYLVRTWLATVRFRYRSLGPSLDPRRRSLRGSYIYAFWHEYILQPASLFGRSRLPIHVLISRHADGQFIAEVAEKLGFQTIRGSTTRGGAEALMQMIRLNGSGHLAFTPDGPRGPRRRLQQGIIYAASRTGLPIVPIGFAYDRLRRAKSWDQFALPMPFATCYTITLEPIAVPPNITPETLEPYRLLVEAAMHRAGAIAEHWARTKQFDPSVNAE